MKSACTRVASTVPKYARRLRCTPPEVDGTISLCPAASARRSLGGALSRHARLGAVAWHGHAPDRRDFNATVALLRPQPVAADEPHRRLCSLRERHGVRAAAAVTGRRQPHVPLDHTIGDAHIKDCSLRITPGPYTAARDTTNNGGTAAFRSKSPSDRDSHMRTLMHGSYGSPRSPVSRSPGHQHMQPSASFRSASPNACAHITAQPKPLNASYELDRRDGSRLGSAAFRSSTSIADAHIKASPKPLDASYELDRRNGSRIGSAAFRSSTSIADAHIKASPRMHDVNVTLTPRGSSRGATSSFKSTTSIGDAHIKALPKPVDVLVAYRD
jgi:hypothetical protein